MSLTYCQLRALQDLWYQGPRPGHYLENSSRRWRSQIRDDL